MLDDDDTVVPEYVEWLLQNQKDCDVVLFQMMYQGGRILPQDQSQIFRRSKVGISFAAQTDLLRRVKFRSCKCEDCFFLNDVNRFKKRVKFVPKVAYRVKH